MKRQRSKGSGACLFSQNVIELKAYRRQRSLTPLHDVLYISQNDRHLAMLSSFCWFDTQSVRTMEELRTRLAHRIPDLILIESKLQWAKALDLIAWLSHMVTTPIVMVCDRAATRKNSVLLKQAFGAGLHDTVFAPLQKEALLETFEVLLKYQRELSLDQ